jgi:hypothetical protein
MGIEKSTETATQKAHREAEERRAESDRMMADLREATQYIIRLDNLQKEFEAAGINGKTFAAIEAELRLRLREEIARKGGVARVAKDTKQLAKREVFELWQLWTQEPYRYASQADFARDMLDKFLALKSQKVIASWSNDWAAEAGLQFNKAAQVWTKCNG